eukprot:13536769-Alexandrium_andersonii.AAC.1
MTQLLAYQSTLVRCIPPGGSLLAPFEARHAANGSHAPTGQPGAAVTSAALDLLNLPPVSLRWAGSSSGLG